MAPSCGVAAIAVAAGCGSLSVKSLLPQVGSKLQQQHKSTIHVSTLRQRPRERLLSAVDTSIQPETSPSMSHIPTRTVLAASYGRHVYNPRGA